MIVSKWKTIRALGILVQRRLRLLEPFVAITIGSMVQQQPILPIMHFIATQPELKLHFDLA